MKAHLKTYFDRCQKALVGGIGVDQELSLLCTQCFEVSCISVTHYHFHVVFMPVCIYFMFPKVCVIFQNAVDKEYCGLSLEHKIEAILKRNLLSSATDILVRSAGVREHTISLDMLESVAKMRYSLLVVAQLLKHRVNEQGHNQSLYGVACHRLLEEARYFALTFSQHNHSE